MSGALLAFAAIYVTTGWILAIDFLRCDGWPSWFETALVLLIFAVAWPAVFAIAIADNVRDWLARRRAERGSND